MVVSILVSTQVSVAMRTPSRALMAVKDHSCKGLVTLLHGVINAGFCPSTVASSASLLWEGFGFVISLSHSTAPFPKNLSSIPDSRPCACESEMWSGTDVLLGHSGERIGPGA